MSGQMNVDVLVVGSGAAGSCRRHRCARRRQRTGCGERVGHWRHQRLVRRLAVDPA